MKNEVFNRKEIKYIISEAKFKILQDILKKFMMLDQYNFNNKPYKVHTLYFDTKHNSFISKSILKPNYKEKIRLRSYNEFQNNNTCFFEIKKKYNHYGNKRRAKILYNDALKFIETGKKPLYKNYMNKQVFDELEYIINKERLYPKVFISYDRIAYYSLEDPNLRVTFDNDIISKRDDLETRLLAEDKYILEIKTNKGLPLWLASTLSENKIYEQSFSKYGEEYKKYCKQIKGGKN